MFPTKTLPRWIVCVILMFVITNGCKNGHTDSVVDDEEYEVIHTDMQYFDFDNVENLSAFFDSIRREHPIPMWIEEDEEIIEKDVLGCIKRIERYRQGKAKYYPDSLVRRCIDFFGFDSAVIDNHGPGVDMTCAEWFLMLAAYYSPDVTCLVHMQTTNHRAGIQNFGSQYNYNPWWSYIIFKRQKGFEVRRIKDDYVKIERIYQLQDENNRLYYLCSNNTSIVGFYQVLFWVKAEDEIVCVAQCDSFPGSHKADFEEIYFNPEQKVWHYCKEDRHSGKLIPVSETPALRLCLEGKNSRFIQESIE